VLEDIKQEMIRVTQDKNCEGGLKAKKRKIADIIRRAERAAAGSSNGKETNI
jgi:hypothetical protein